MSDIILSSASYIFCSFMINDDAITGVAKLASKIRMSNPHFLVFMTKNAPKNDGDIFAVKQLML